MTLIEWLWSLVRKANPLSDDAVSSREISLNGYDQERVDQSRPPESERKERR
jgi:hypothetical protein